MSGWKPINLDGTVPGKTLPRERYNYAEDGLLNRHLGEPVDFDAAGYVRQKTWRWFFSKLLGCEL